MFRQFHNFKDKVKVLQNAKKLKGSNISINERFNQKKLAYGKELCNEVIINIILIFMNTFFAE